MAGDEIASLVIMRVEDQPGDDGPGEVLERRPVSLHGVEEDAVQGVLVPGAVILLGDIPIADLGSGLVAPDDMDLDGRAHTRRQAVGIGREGPAERISRPVLLETKGAAAEPGGAHLLGRQGLPHASGHTKLGHGGMEVGVCWGGLGWRTVHEAGRVGGQHDDEVKRRDVQKGHVVDAHPDAVTAAGDTQVDDVLAGTQNGEAFEPSVAHWPAVGWEGLAAGLVGRLDLDMAVSVSGRVVAADEEEGLLVDDFAVTDVVEGEHGG